MLRTISRRAKKAPGILNRALCKLGIGAFCYAVQIRLLFIACGPAWMQQLLFRKHAQQVRQFLKETGLEESLDAQDFVRFNRVGHAVKHWWFGAFRAMSEADLKRIIQVEGWEHFEQARGGGKGVIIVHHHIDVVHLAWAMLKRMRVAEPMVTIGKEWAVPIAAANDKAPADEAKAASQMKFDYLRQLQSGKQALNAGGLVRILPDGFRGDSTAMCFDFFGRRREFRPSFADLALMTGAAVIPVSANMNSTGQFTITFHPELKPLSGSDRKAKSAELVSAYVSYLEQQWKSPSLRFISESTLSNFLELPRAGSGEAP